MARSRSAGAPIPQSGNQYVDSKLCVGCHAQIAATYRHTGMARSFFHPSAENTIENYASGLPFHHSPTSAFYAMAQRAGKYFQTRWQAGPDGKKINLQEWQIDFIMGSGNHVRTYLHRSANGTLIELPLAWYSEKGGFWAMNPGYDTDHFIAPRKIAYECMACHNAYPRIPAGHERANSVPAYLDPIPEGIDCQRCHGPGALHVKFAQTAGSPPEEIRNAILNPARLSGDRQMEVCMQCHLETTSFRLPAAIRLFDRGPFSYRAGEPLGNFMLFFDRAPDPERRPKFEIVSSVVRLRQSQCFLQSKGALTCLTCHDPHNIPRGKDAAAHYTAACRQCHSGAFDSLIAGGRHTGEPDCIGCHMPKRRTDDVVHAVMTDHLIQRNKPSGDLLAEIPEAHETDESAYHGIVVPYYPRGVNALYLAVVQVEHKSNLAGGIAQLAAAIEAEKPRNPQFYFELGEAWRSKGDAVHAVATYEQAIARDPGAAWTLRRLADALLATGAKSRAAEVLNRAVRAAPDDARGWFALGELDADTGRTIDAVAAFQRAVKLDPELPDAYNSLGSLLAGMGKAQEAENAFRSALRAQPDLADAQSNLGALLGSKGALAEAAFYLEHALQATPDNTTARCNYAITLARLNRPDEAEKQLELALKTDSGFAEAHLDLGILLADKGDLDGAAAHLRQASASTNPAIKQKALQILRDMGKR